MKFDMDLLLHGIVMRPSSLGGGRILRRTLSVCLSVCRSVRLSVRPVSGCTLFTVAPSYERTSKIEKTSVFTYGPASRMYFSARAEGRISYGHLGRTNSCFSLVCIKYIGGEKICDFRLKSLFISKMQYTTIQ